ncbi:5-methylcytosine-specific restriction endonuclease McrA [Polymorphobacter multimanifer]|uniref:5-methylcytosine-specific restriction endonuclease McrA n=1 Tax=Polymorphobacter multimanifer TaxID=1070431 RepID=A0A841LBJ2_9SPHN|nr:HNH endonuclease signature motif containing protein [Polymorphobacter multimanifer]MBB6228343.1 5-methylcytosine-specific restriction endonuclease McrA [Polymorphobacter multimanifer]
MSGPSDHPAAAYPLWLPMPAVPVRVIVGPPGNGAALFVAGRMQPGEVSIDVAAIIAELSSGQAATGGGDWIIRALEARNARLAALAKPEDITGAWLIAGAPKQWQRDFWSRTLGAEIIVLDPGKQAAIAGAAAENVAVKYVHRWYAEAQDAMAGMMMPAARTTPPPRETRPIEPRESSSKRGYGSTHRVLRDKQLAREPWCRFCWEERKQKVPATVLDHILPFKRPDDSTDWKLWGDPKNHRSLCKPCHDARGAQRGRAEKPAGAATNGRPMDPAHPWNRK